MANEVFAKRLKELRKEKNMTQKDLANELGVSMGSIGFYENQERTPDIDFLVKVSDYFEVSTEYLLGKSDSVSNDPNIRLFLEKTERDLLKAELERVNIAFEPATKALDKRQPEWISVEDKPLPKLSDEIKEVWPCYPNDLPVYIAFYGNGARNGVTHWMMLDAPKPKEPTFKDVFLKAFPKAAIENVIKINCIEFFFPQFNVDTVDCEKARCSTCWNQPYFEAKEEGGEE